MRLINLDSPSNRLFSLHQSAVVVTQFRNGQLTSSFHVPSARSCLMPFSFSVLYKKSSAPGRIMSFAMHLYIPPNRWSIACRPSVESPQLLSPFFINVQPIAGQANDILAARNPPKINIPPYRVKKDITFQPKCHRLSSRRDLVVPSSDQTQLNPRRVLMARIRSLGLFFWGGGAKLLAGFYYSTEPSAHQKLVVSLLILFAPKEWVVVDAVLLQRFRIECHV